MWNSGRFRSIGQRNWPVQNMAQDSSIYWSVVKNHIKKWSNKTDSIFSIYNRNCISGRNWTVIWNYFFFFNFILLKSFRSKVRMNGQTKLMLFLVSLIETASLGEIELSHEKYCSQPRKCTTKNFQIRIEQWNHRRFVLPTGLYALVENK